MDPGSYYRNQNSYLSNGGFTTNTNHYANQNYIPVPRLPGYLSQVPVPSVVPHSSQLPVSYGIQQPAPSAPQQPAPMQLPVQPSFPQPVYDSQVHYANLGDGSQWAQAPLMPPQNFLTPSSQVLSQDLLFSKPFTFLFSL